MAFPTRKALALLALLVCEGASKPRAELAALFWPESDDARARGALRYTLSTLRTCLGEGAGIVADRDAVAFAREGSGLELDVDALDALHDRLRKTPRGAEDLDEASLQRALALCEGELLQGFSLPECPGFEDWLARRRAELERRVVVVFERLGHALEARAAQDAARDVAERWRTRAPLDEAAYRLLMRASAARGDRVGALRAYEACRELLARELDTVPSTETEALAARLRGDVAPRSFATAGSAPTSRHPDATLPETPLVGRAPALELLTERYLAVTRGASEVVMLVGEAGIGKTRLASELAGWAAAQGADVLQGRAFETGGRLPYQPLVDALRGRVENENAPDDVLDDVWLVELSRILVELRERYPDLPAPAGDDGTSRTRLFEAITRLVAAFAARAPVVLLVDDLQWADNASMDVLYYAAKRWRESGARVLLVLAIRAEAFASPVGLPPWITGLDRSLQISRLDLESLSLADTQRMMRALGEPGAPNDDFAAWLHAETNGQPFFITETLRALAEAGHLAARRDEHSVVLELRAGLQHEPDVRGLLPPGIKQVVRARLERLAPSARDVLTAAAVLGQAFSFDRVRAVAEVGENEALAAVEELGRARLLREVPGKGGAAPRYFFTHDKIRDVVYVEASDARRRVFHRRAFELLRASGARAAELAAHAASAGLAEAAADATMTAGIEAMKLLAAADAIAHFTQVIDLARELGRPAMLLEAEVRRVKARASIGQWAQAKRDLEGVLARLDPAERERRAELFVDLAEACFWTLEVPAVREACTVAVELAQELGRADLEMAARGWLGAANGADGELQDAIAHYEDAVAMAERRGGRPPAHVLTFHALSLYWHGSLEKAAARSRAAVDVARASQDVSILLYSLSHLGLSMSARGHYAEADAAFAEALRYGREYRIESLLARAVAMAAGARLETFDFAAAEAMSLEACELSRSAAWPPAGASASIDLLFNMVRRGEVGRAEEMVAKVAETVAKAAGFHGWLWRLRLAEGRAEIALARGDVESALAGSTHVVEVGARTGRSKYRALGLVTRGRALARLGRTAPAAADLRLAASIAKDIGDPTLFLRAAAPLLDVDGDDGLLEEARAVAERLGRALADERVRGTYAAGLETLLAPGSSVRLLGAKPSA